MLIKYNGTSRLWMISIAIDGNPVVWLGQDMMTGMRLLNRLAHDDCICAGGFVAEKPIAFAPSGWHDCGLKHIHHRANKT